MVRTSDPGMHAIPINAPEQLIQRTIPLLERQIDDAIAAKPLTVDLVMAGVQIIDSAGLNWLLGVQARLDALGIRLRLTTPAPIVCDILLATRLDARFMMQASADAEAGGADGRS